MEPERVELAMYGSRMDHEPLAWAHVEAQLATADFYWVSTGAGVDPHPRPVWGVWVDGALLLSLGSPVLRRSMAIEPHVAVHLGSGTDVAIVNGTAAPDASPETVRAFVDAYDRKYDWAYDVAQFGPPTRVSPTEVLAWRAVGQAGRDGFQASAKWTWGRAGGASSPRGPVTDPSLA